jgi:hypothetical protein
MTILRKRKKEASYIMNDNATWLLPFCTDKNNKMCEMLFFFKKFISKKKSRSRSSLEAVWKQQYFSALFVA